MRFLKMASMASVVAAIALGGAAAPALAQTSDAPLSMTVRVAGLDLNSPQGAKEALRRIEDAAVAVCGAPSRITDLDSRAAYEPCRKSAVLGAVRALDRPALTQVAAAYAPVRPMMVAER